MGPGLEQDLIIVTKKLIRFDHVLRSSEIGVVHLEMISLEAYRWHTQWLGSLVNLQKRNPHFQHAVSNCGNLVLNGVSF